MTVNLSEFVESINWRLTSLGNQNGLADHGRYTTNMCGFFPFVEAHACLQTETIVERRYDVASSLPGIHVFSDNFPGTATHAGFAESR
jgi:hypothetical protein